jgi:hypothetical protein
MPCINNINAFQCILQQNDYWCIPASIENVMKYHRQNTNITQNRIVQLFIQRYNLDNTMSFDTVSQVLKSNYGRHWDFDPRPWPSATQLINHVRNCIVDNLPTIVSMDLPDREGQHMFVVLCIRGNNLTVFDPGFRTNRSRPINRDFFLNHLSPGRGTLTISPKYTQIFIV